MIDVEPAVAAFESCLAKTRSLSPEKSLWRGIQFSLPCSVVLEAQRR